MAGETALVLGALRRALIIQVGRPIARGGDHERDKGADRAAGKKNR
jgi:hypothetical protein